MNILVYYILPIIGSMFILGSMFYGSYQMGGAADNKDKIRWWLIVLYIIISIALSLLGESYINLITLLIAPIVSKYAFHTPKRYLIYYYIMCAAVFLTDAVFNVGFYSLINHKIIYFIADEMYFICYLLASRLLEFLVIQIIVFLVRRYTNQYFTKKQIIVSFVLPTFSLINMYTLLYFLQIYITNEMIQLFIINMLLLIGINFYFTALIDTISKNNRLENEKNLYQQQVQMQTQYYEQEEDKYEVARKLIHDIRNHIQVMEGLYKQDSAKEAITYTADIHQMLNKFDRKYYSSNRLLNIILNDKVQLMKRYEIKEDIKIGDVSLDFMKDVDITTLFANLLDNCIEAAKESKAPYVRLRVTKVHQFISISAENSCTKEPISTKDGFLSRKKGHEGIGLKNIKKVVETFEGDLQSEWKDGIFYTTIMLVELDCI